MAEHRQVPECFIACPTLGKDSQDQNFVRAAGDRLTNIRIMMVSGLPLERLGEHWVDRVISAKLYELGYLECDAAIELMCRPIPDFPEIYREYRGSSFHPDAKSTNSGRCVTYSRRVTSRARRTRIVGSAPG